MRHRCEEGTIGFNVEAIEWHESRCLAQRVGVLKGHHSRYGYVTAEFQAALSIAGCASEAVDHRARWHALTLKYIAQIVECVASVDHEGQVQLLGERDLGHECGALDRTGRMFVKIVKSALPDPH